MSKFHTVVVYAETQYSCGFWRFFIYIDIAMADWFVQCQNRAPGQVSSCAGSVPSDVFELDYRTDLPAISKEMWGKCTFCGNVDPSGVLCMGTEWDIIEKTTRLLEAQKENPRFILNAGCALPQSPWKKICARL